MCVKLNFQKLVLIVDCLLFSKVEGGGGGVVVWYLPEHYGKYSIKSKWRSKVCVKLTHLMTFFSQTIFQRIQKFVVYLTLILMTFVNCQFFPTPKR